MLNRSRVIFAPSPDETSDGIPSVMAYNEQDDHLRLTVLLAHSLGAGCDAKNVATCLDKTTPWPARRKALREVLDEKRKAVASTFVRFVDPDALDVDAVTLSDDLSPSDKLAPPTQWEDTSFRRERGELFDLLMDRFDAGGWELVRTEPRRSTSDKLSRIDLEEIDRFEAKDEAKTADDLRLEAVMSARVSPALQPLIEAMVRTEKLRARTAARMLEASSTPRADDLVLLLAYDLLSVDAIEAGKRLALQRGPQRWNGVAGAFQKTKDFDQDWPDRLDTVPEAAAEELEHAAWLSIRRSPDGSRRYAMSNAVRRFLAGRASFTDPERVQREYLWLAKKPPTSVEESVEAHYHAVASGDDDLAIRTAEYYGSDLRKIAFALSADKKYDKAARLYRVIVDQFDGEDAYAWEYFAYNLAFDYTGKGFQPREIPLPDRGRIRDAYMKASSFDKSNPLYRGRELAFRVRLGESVHEEFGRAIDAFRRTVGEDGVSFLARPVLQAMRDIHLPLTTTPWAAKLKQHPDLRGFFL